MADKKITALSALGAGDPDPAVDLLHIIDYSAAPVNKKITIANLFSRVDTNTTIVGASKTFEVEHALGTSVLEVVTNTVVAGSEATVSINKDEHSFVDFSVSSTSGAAISVDASADTVTINGDSEAAIDFTINGDTGINFFSDGGLQCVGIGTGTVDGTTTLTVAADATTGHSINAAGNLLLSGTETVVGSADGTGAGVISLLTPISLISIADTKAYSLAAGTQGQIKTLICSAVSGTPAGTVTPVASANDGYNTILFNAVGETATLMYANSAWMILSLGGTSAALAAGSGPITA